jgi:hypothetical protein
VKETLSTGGWRRLLPEPVMSNGTHTIKSGVEGRHVNDVSVGHWKTSGTAIRILVEELKVW